MSTPVDEFTHAIKTFNKVIDGVLQHPPGPKRWRAANNLWLSLSSKHRQVYRETVDENSHTRELVTKHGQALKTTIGNTDKNMRNYLNIPAGAYMAIAKADPEAFTNKANAPKFFKEFKEYTTREVY